MDRVFMPAMSSVVSEPEPSPDIAAAAPLAHEDDSIEVEVREAPAMTPAAPRPVAAAPHQTPPAPAAPPSRIPVAWRRSPWARSPWQPRRPLFSGAWLSTPWQIAGVPVSPKLAIACSGGLACLALGTSATLWLGWNQASADLRQERTIRLIEGIRGLNPGTDTASTAAAATAKANKPGESADGLPPPPPNEPWIEDLGQLDGQGGGGSGGGSGGGGGAAPLQVPVNGTLRAPAPVATAAPSPGPATPPPPVPSSGGGGGGSPELVGVVQIPGKPGSAIFQVGGSSTNASAGESIGSSGWRLLSTNGDSAVIERAGVRRSVSISSGF